MEKRIHIKIYGLVQGVFFRVEAQKTAQKLGLLGWVKNMKDNTVEIIAEGPEKKLIELEEWCKTGPQYSTVEKIESEISPATKKFNNFEIHS